MYLTNYVNVNYVRNYVKINSVDKNQEDKRKGR